MAKINQILDKYASIQQLYRELNAIIESSYDGLMITDQRGKIIIVNQALARICGLEAAYFEDKTAARLYEEGVLRSESLTLRALKEKRPVTGTQKLHNNKEVIVTSSPVYDDDCNVLRVVTNVRDITEISQLKEEARVSALLATRYQAELTNFTAEYLRQHKIIAVSPAMVEVLNLVVRAARTDVTVLLLGESGAGKEVLARMIHNISQRVHTGSFIKINCGAIPENLLESELFGYEPGSFTGASPKGKPGMFEIANHGTLLLDEIADLPLNLQVKLLRVLQEQEVYRIGATSSVKLDVRIIASTNRNIEAQMREGLFRRDLYYRLNVLPIEAPPLRERVEDILPLAEHFIQLYNEKYGMKRRLDPQAVTLLEEYDWPGNVRELQNVLERLLVVSDDPVIPAAQVRKELAKYRAKGKSPVSVHSLLPLKEAKNMLEKQLIELAFDSYPSVRKVAEVLGIDRSNVARKVAKYGIKTVVPGRRPARV